MIRIGIRAEETRDSISSKPVMQSNVTTMDITSTKYSQASSLFPSNNKDSTLEGNTNFFSKNKETPFADTFPDPLCKINLKETCEFVKSFPMGNNSCENRDAQRKREGVSSVAQRRREAPLTPGRPVFGFSVGNLSRKSYPSKWDDAEKWLISSSCHDSPAHLVTSSESSNISKQNEVFFQPRTDFFAEKSRVTEEKVSMEVSSFRGSPSSKHANPAEILLKDKFTDNAEPLYPTIKYLEPSKEGFLFRNTACESMEDEAATYVMVPKIRHREIGTETTPLGSSTTSRCHTPFKSSSPARHNTPASRSGPLGGTLSTDISQLKECDFAKLELELGKQFDSIVSNWSSRQEEEEEVSKSLRHFEKGNGCRKTITESRASTWEEEEKTKCCIRYQKEEAKIQAWVNLQTAKAEAQSRKLEVKIQKMRSNLEEKQMKRISIVHRKAEELRAAAQFQHSEQMLRATQHAQKMKSLYNDSFSDHIPCGCFPCNNHL